MSLPSRAFVFLAMIGALSCERRPADPVILALGDESVRRSEFERHLHAFEEKGTPALDPSVRTALLEPFLEERALVFEARRRGLLKSGATADDEQAAVQKLLTDEVLSKVQVTEDEVSSYYHEHTDEFRIPESVTLRQILVATQAEALDIRRRLLKDPKSFEALAQSRSRSPEASTGGSMGTFSRGQLPPELEQAAFPLPVAGLSDVVSSPLGFHVLRVEARQPARDRSLAESQVEIRSILVRDKSDQATRQFVRELLTRAKVNHEAALPSRTS